MTARDFARVAGRPVKIGVVEKNENPYWDTVNAGFADAAAQLNLKIDVSAPPYEDVEKQIALIDQFLNAGVDAVAFVASDPKAFDAVVNRAHARGVPAVTFDLDAPDSGRIFYFGMQSPIESGRSAGKIMVELLNGRGKVAVQTGSDRAQGAVGKLRGFIDVMNEHRIEVVGGDNDGEHIDLADKNARSLLQRHPDIDGFFGVYGYHPGVQARAVQASRPKKRPIIVGFDMLPETVSYMGKGLIDSSIWIREYYFGYYTAAALSCIARIGASEALEMMAMSANNLPSNRRLIPIQAITQQTVGSFLEWSTRTGVRPRPSGLADLSSAHA